ncbi:MAG: carboxylesterase family protein [Myxococcota bacterium]
MPASPHHVRPRGAAALPTLFALVVACSGDAPPPAPDASSTRALSQGEVVGFAHPDFAAHAWKGLPFAAPPTGELRWRAPRPPASWTGVREAVASASECVQYDPADPDDVIGSEDCLYLDVYAPRLARDAVPTGDARLPVMVWIHGGGNSIGGAAMYDAARLAAEGDVVVVAIQYRLGVLGWLSHPALRAGAATPDDASGNYGTLDAIRALEWVRDEIASFGGDPGNVTIFGESAGGIDVFALLLSPRAKGLFHRAIAQSGVVVSTPRAEAEGYADANPRQVGSNEMLLRWLLEDGLATSRDDAKARIAAMSPAEIESYLRAKSAPELLSIFRDGIGGGMYYVPQIIRDGHVVPDVEPLEAFARPDGHNAVPTIAGTNREETKLFAMMGSPNVRRVFGMPVGVRDTEAFDLEGEYGGLLWKAQGADQPLTAMRSAGRDDVYGYRFDWDEEGTLLWVDLGELLGASHAVEMLFVFGFTDLGRYTDNVFADLPSAERLSRQMRSYWTHFARTGAPGRGADGDLPPWKPWGADADAEKYLVFDSAAGGGLRMEGDAVDVDDVVARLAADPRVTGAEQRCALFRGLVEWSGAFEPEDYAAFEDGACRTWPLELPALPGL